MRIIQNSRKFDINRLIYGLECADLLICISESTRSGVKCLFSNKKTALIRHQLNIDYWNPKITLNIRFNSNLIIPSVVQYVDLRKELGEDYQLVKNFRHSP